MKAEKQELIDQLAQLLGPGGLLTGADLAGRDPGWNKLKSLPLAVLRPKTTDHVAAALALCNQYRQPVVTQGGKTGMADGSATVETDIALSLERMNGIESIDAVSRTMTVKAGTPLQVVQEAAEEHGLSFPLDLGARGSATIGGNIATNAGGNRVIRYGMARNHILGLEAVLADGTVIPAMHSVVKNNTGYDLKHWFIGSEGTLGVVTRAVLKLSPLPTSQNTALLAVQEFDQVAQLLTELDRDFGGSLAAFEVMWNSFFTVSTDTDTATGKKSPMDRSYPYYILIEAMGADQQTDAESFELVLEKVFEAGLVADAVIAKSRAERDALWEIRDNIESLFNLWPIYTFDVSLPIPAMEAYLAKTSREIKRRWPESHFISFGHLGDGNLHVIVAPGEDKPENQRLVENTVYQGLSNIGGVVSAEHGIGLEKKDFLHFSRSETEITMMKTIKRSLDPNNTLNPGKIFDL
jgi:FAD/FMN-containing dehydrogenase